MTVLGRLTFSLFNLVVINLMIQKKWFLYVVNIITITLIGLSLFYRIFGWNTEIKNAGYVAMGLSFGIIMTSIQLCIMRQLALLTYN